MFNNRLYRYVGMRKIAMGESGLARVSKKISDWSKSGGKGVDDLLTQNSKHLDDLLTHATKNNAQDVVDAINRHKASKPVSTSAKNIINDSKPITSEAENVAKNVINDSKPMNEAKKVVNPSETQTAKDTAKDVINESKAVDGNKPVIGSGSRARGLLTDFNSFKDPETQKRYDVLESMFDKYGKDPEEWPENAFRRAEGLFGLFRGEEAKVLKSLDSKGYNLDGFVSRLQKQHVPISEAFNGGNFADFNLHTTGGVSSEMKDRLSAMGYKGLKSHDELSKDKIDNLYSHFEKEIRPNIPAQQPVVQQKKKSPKLVTNKTKNTSAETANTPNTSNTQASSQLPNNPDSGSDSKTNYAAIAAGAAGIGAGVGGAYLYGNRNKEKSI